jgi:hypothetical protein
MISLTIYTIVLFLVLFKAVFSSLNITLGLLAPLHGPKVFGEEMFHLINDTFLMIKADSNFPEIQRRDVNFIYKFRDTHCNIGQGLYELVSVMDFQAGDGTEIDAFIGECKIYAIHFPFPCL